MVKVNVNDTRCGGAIVRCICSAVFLARTEILIDPREVMQLKLNFSPRLRRQQRSKSRRCIMTAPWARLT